ncbi:MAG: sensor domain-containing protein, partial [Halobaculum sp.]
MGEPTHTTDPAGRSFVRRVFGVVGRRETYRNLVYLLARFPIGIAYFTTITTLVSLGIGLLPLLVGVPILLGALGVGGYIGVVEAGLLNHLRDRQLSYEPAHPTDSSLQSYLTTLVTTPRNYLLLVF